MKIITERTLELEKFYNKYSTFSLFNFPQFIESNEFQKDFAKLSEESKLDTLFHCSKLIKYIKKPSDDFLILALKRNTAVLPYILNPSKAVQLESVQKIKADHLDFFMQYARKRINYSKALNLLYKKVPDEYKDKIKSHPNYKNDAQLILERLNE